MKSNAEIGNRGLRYFSSIFHPFVIRKIKKRFGPNWIEDGLYQGLFPQQKIPLHGLQNEAEIASRIAFDACITLFRKYWQEIFKFCKQISPYHLPWANEIRIFRNELAHLGIEDISTRKVARAFDTMSLFLENLDPEADAAYSHLTAILLGKIEDDIEEEEENFSENFFLHPQPPLLIEQWPLLITNKSLNSKKNIIAIEFQNRSSKDVVYFEFSVTDFIDTVGRPVDVDYPYVIKVEEKIAPGERHLITQRIENLNDADDFVPLLKVVRYASRVLEKYDANYTFHEISEPRKISSIISEDRIAFQKAMQQKVGAKRLPEFIHEENVSGFWYCAFCGIVNKQDRFSCQVCAHPVEDQKHFSEEMLLDYYQQWSVAYQKRCREIIEEREQRRKLAEQERKQKKKQKEQEHEQRRIQAEQEESSRKALRFIFILLGAVTFYWGAPYLVNWIRLYVSFDMYKKVSFAIIFFGSIIGGMASNQGGAWDTIGMVVIFGILGVLIAVSLGLIVYFSFSTFLLIIVLVIGALLLWIFSS